MDFRRGQHLSAIGVTGTGKSFFCKNAVLPPFSRVIVIDTEGDDPTGGTDFHEFPRKPIDTIIRLAESNYPFAVRYEATVGDLAPILELCRGLLSPTVRVPLALYFDEITDFTTPSSIPKSLLNLIRKARKHGISVVTATQRPQLLNKSFLANSVHRVYFHVADYDAGSIKDYAPFLIEHESEIPYGSYRCIYKAPSGGLVVLEPAPPYDWAKRLKPK